jgi:hypothetical protein
MDSQHTNSGKYPLTVGIDYFQTNRGVLIGGMGGIRVELGSDPTVRVPKVVTKSVGFVAEVMHEDSAGAGLEYLATGFFVCVPFSRPELAHKRLGYFVTAAHVAKHLSDKPICLVVNKRGGGLTGIATLEKGWFGHPTDRSADVVVLPVILNPDADMTCVAVKDFVVKGDFASNRVGVGDELFVTGLFTAVPGISRLMPIVRHGNIAMLPEEQIQTEMGYADVYLAEARSIGGLSGSPVFVRTDSAADPNSGSGIKLLGLMQGHWDIRETELNKPKIINDRKRGVNLGIGVVVPATKILEAINSPMQVEGRMAIEEKLINELVPGSDIADREEPEGESFTQTDFEDALKKASRKVET